MSVFSDKSKAMHHQMSLFLRRQRKDAGLTMRELSQRLGTPHSFIGKIENQHRRIDIAEFVLYCESLNKDPKATFEQMLSQLGRHD